MDFDTIMTFLNYVPTNTEMGVYMDALNDWFAARTLVVTPALAAFGWLGYKTPWSKSSKLVHLVMNIFRKNKGTSKEIKNDEESF